MSTRMKSRQKGLVLIAMVLVVFITASSMYFIAMSNRPGSGSEVQEKIETREQLLLAKQALINYSISYSDAYTDNGLDYLSGPGRLPCPDITSSSPQPYGSGAGPNGSLSWMWCESAYFRHRLPEYVNLPSGSRYYFNDYFVDVDQHFWYAVAPMYAHSTYPNSSRNYEPLNSTETYTALNGSMGDTFTLDGEEVVAVIIAPGEGLSNQSRPSDDYSNNFYDYLESINDNWWSTNFASNDGSDIDNFNDLAIAITHSELMTVVTAKVASEIKKQLDQDHPGNGDSYPVNQTAFENDMDAGAIIPPWYTNGNGDGAKNVGDQWDDVANYTRISPDEATVNFTNCAIAYTLHFTNGISRSPNQC